MASAAAYYPPSAELCYTNVLAIVCYVNVFGVQTVRPSGPIAEVNRLVVVPCTGAD